MDEIGARRKAWKKYNLKRYNKTVSFRLGEDDELLEFAQSLPDFGAWVRAKIRDSLGADGAGSKSRGEGL